MACGRSHRTTLAFGRDHRIRSRHRGIRETKPSAMGDNGTIPADGTTATSACAEILAAGRRLYASLAIGIAILIAISTASPACADETITLTYQGIDRLTVIHATALSSPQPPPLVIALHGFTQSIGRLRSCIYL